MRLTPAVLLRHGAVVGMRCPSTISRQEADGTIPIGFVARCGSELTKHLLLLVPVELAFRRQP